MSEKATIVLQKPGVLTSEPPITIRKFRSAAVIAIARKRSSRGRKGDNPRLFDTKYASQDSAVALGLSSSAYGTRGAEFAGIDQ